jgi:ABC-type multidrug transport system fused ATPase/permease subunit
VRLTQSLGLISFYGGLIHSSLPQLRAASAFIQQMDPEGLATTSRIAEGLTTLGTFRGRLPELPAEADQGALSISGPPSLRVRDLSFRYPGVAGLVFEGLDLDVAPGAQLGVVGRSGSGKSTLLALLLGVLRPERGEVLIGGQPAMVFLEQYAQRVGFVGAEPFLVMGSLRDNLSYGSSRKFTPEEYRAALESASLLPWVESLPEGLDYFIQEDGSGLSAGQKQRLALARALLRQPVLLVADEVSANLDQQTEAEVARMIAGLKGRTTVLLVSHRRELLVHADAILTVSDEGHELAAGPGREPTERSTGLGAG